MQRVTITLEKLPATPHSYAIIAYASSSQPTTPTIQPKQSKSHGLRRIQSLLRAPFNALPSKKTARKVTSAICRLIICNSSSSSSKNEQQQPTTSTPRMAGIQDDDQEEIISEIESSPSITSHITEASPEVIASQKEKKSSSIKKKLHSFCSALKRFSCFFACNTRATSPISSRSNQQQPSTSTVVDSERQVDILPLHSTSPLHAHSPTQLEDCKHVLVHSPGLTSALEILKQGFSSSFPIGLPILPVSRSLSFDVCGSSDSDGVSLTLCSRSHSH